MQIGDKIRFILGEGVETGKIEKINKSSVIVNFRGSSIKRHVEKHRCQIVKEKGEE